MKVKAGQAQSILAAIVAVKEARIPTNTAYWLARTGVQLDSEIKAFEKVRMDLVRQFGKKDEDGELILDDEGQADISDLEGFQAEFEELANQEFEIKMDALSVDQFEDPKKPGESLLSVEIMAGLLPLIKEPE